MMTPDRILERPIHLFQFLIAFTLLAGACKGCGPSRAELREAGGEASRITRLAEEQGLAAALEQATDTAVVRAIEIVGEARDYFDGGSPEVIAIACRALLESDLYAESVACLDRAATENPETPRLRLLRAEVLAGLGEHVEARRILAELRDIEPAIEGVREQLLAAFVEDPLFLRPVLTVERGNQISQIRSLGGGSTITMKFKLDGETIAAFKPNQTRRQSDYRAEVAAYRLCPILRCGFEIPYSFEARIERRDFMRLYGISSLDPEFLISHEGYAANFVDLIWTNDSDGTFLYGVWKDWVPHFTKFPIEYDDVWDSWVSVDGDVDDLEQPLEEALRPLRGRDRGYYSELLEEAGELTTIEFAGQISNIISFDFLINNWDRFSGAYYGVNCQFANGHFVSIDNGAGFMTRDPARPRQRLHQVSRFSRSFLREIRELDRETLLPILFPNPSRRETERFDAFWERRTELLDYVDNLIEERGEDEVVFFP